MNGIVAVLILVFGLLASIAIHELGHLVPAKKFGVKVSEYFVGFGPTIFSRIKGETEYGLKAIPLGGYVRLLGMVPPETEVKPVRVGGWIGTVIAETRAAASADLLPEESDRAFYRLTWWRKLIVMFGGPLTNLVLAAIIFTAVLSGIGVPTTTLKIADIAPCVSTSECSATDPISPAAAAGLQPGDVFVEADGRPVANWSELTELIAVNGGRSVSVTVLRDGEPLDLVVTPALLARPQLDDKGELLVDANGDLVLAESGYLGVYAAQERQGRELTAGIKLTGDYLTATAQVVAKLPVHVYHVARAAFGLEERDPGSVMGIVGVGRVATDVASADIAGYGGAEKFADLLMLLGGLNLALFAFNMIPLVPLDGGHIAGALWQGIKQGWAKLRGRASAVTVDVARMMPVAYVVFGLLLLMTVVLVYADIVAPVELS